MHLKKQIGSLHGNKWAELQSIILYEFRNEAKLASKIEDLPSCVNTCSDHVRPRFRYSQLYILLTDSSIKSTCGLHNARWTSQFVPHTKKSVRKKTSQATRYHRSKSLTHPKPSHTLKSQTNIEPHPHANRLGRALSHIVVCHCSVGRSALNVKQHSSSVRPQLVLGHNETDERRLGSDSWRTGPRLERLASMLNWIQ